jgi:hypothetical protein
MLNLLMLATTKTEEDSNVWIEFFVAWGPLVALCLIIFFSLRSYSSKVRKLQDRSYQHMDALEAKLDKVIAQLDEILSREGEDR